MPGKLCSSSLFNFRTPLLNFHQLPFLKSMPKSLGPPLIWGGGAILPIYQIAIVIACNNCAPLIIVHHTK